MSEVFLSKLQTGKTSMTVKEGLSPLYELCLPPTIDLEVTSKPSEVYVALEIDCFICLVSKNLFPAPSPIQDGNCMHGSLCKTIFQCASAECTEMTL